MNPWKKLIILILTIPLKKKFSADVGLVLLLLTLISTIIVSERTVFPDVPKRIEIEKSILDGTMEPPYQYRIMKTLSGSAIQFIISPFVENEITRHTLAYQILLFLTFSFVYALMYSYFRRFFSEGASITGLFLFIILIPLSITSIWEEGDYITLLFYLAGLSLMFSGREKWLPLLIAVGEINRDQIIFLLAFYAAYLYLENRLWDRRAWLTMLLSVAAWLSVYLLLRLIFGFKVSVYTIAHNVSSNISLWKQILELWIVMVSVFAVLSIASFKKSSRFFKAGLISLIPYIMIFSVLAIITQFAKFLPAYLILIPMALQKLTGEYTTDTAHNGDELQKTRVN